MFGSIALADVDLAVVACLPCASAWVSELNDNVLHAKQEVSAAVVACGDECWVRLFDKATGELFAECPVPQDKPIITVGHHRAARTIGCAWMLGMLSAYEQRDNHVHACSKYKTPAAADYTNLLRHADFSNVALLPGGGARGGLQPLLLLAHCGPPLAAPRLHWPGLQV